MSAQGEGEPGVPERKPVRRLITSMSGRSKGGDPGGGPSSGGAEGGNKIEAPGMRESSPREGESNQEGATPFNRAPPLLHRLFCKISKLLGLSSGSL